MGHKDIDGRKVATQILDTVREDAAVLTESGWQPRLISATVGDIQEVQLYVRSKRCTTNHSSGSPPCP